MGRIFLGLLISLFFLPLSMRAEEMASRLELPLTEAEIVTCSQLSQKMRNWNLCQVSSHGCGDFFVENYGFADQNWQATGEDFRGPFAAIEGGWKNYFSAVRHQFSENFSRYPLRMLASLALTAVDVGAAVLAPKYFPIVHGLTWSVSIYIWGQEGLDLLRPCQGLTPETSVDRLRLCLAAVQRQLPGNGLQSEVFSQQSFAEAARQAENGLPFRFACAALEESADILDQQVASIRCVGDGKIELDGLIYQVNEDLSLRSEQSWFLALIQDGEVSIERRFGEDALVPGPLVAPSWSLGLPELVEVFWPRIRQVAPHCISSEGFTLF